MEKHHIVIIGAGPGGYVAAIRAAQLGMDVACVDREKELGGTCLRVGCIPSKAMLESSERYWEAREELKKHGVLVGDVKLDLATMLKRKDQTVQALTRGVDALFKKNGVTRYQGKARLAGARKVVVEGATEIEIEANHIILATGSAAADLPGVELDGDRIGSSSEALSFDEAPKRLVVIGAGYIGMELGSVWNRLGSKVIVLEYLNRILPNMDGELAREAQKIFERQGLEIRLGCPVSGARAEDDECIVEVGCDRPLRCDRVLLAVGRHPYVKDLGLETVGIELDEAGRIPVDERFRTTADGVYAIGDVIRGPMLAHKASEEGMACVEGIAGRFARVNYDAIPSVVYTDPEVASVGRTEDSLQDDGVAYRKGVFPLRASGRARTLGRTDGFVKILADAESDRLLGVHILGPRAGDMIAEAAVAIEFGASSEDLARACHAHPTLAEAMKEAALAANERGIHF